MKTLDCEKNEIKVGDMVIAGRAGYMYRGYAYQIKTDKVLVSSVDPKISKPRLIGYGFSTELINSTVRQCGTLMKP